MSLKSRKDYRIKRHRRVRRKVSGTGERPRMALMKSNKNIYIQFIDDVNAVTLASVSTAGLDTARNIEAARELGKRAGEAAVSKGIRRVVVDRGGFPFRGRIKAIVEAAEGAGLTMRNVAKPEDGEEK